jgi:hypothetical protein
MSPEKPQDAGAPEIEVTPEMIEAGVNAFFLNKSEDWSSPGGVEMDDMMRAIFLAMWSIHCDPENNENTKSCFPSRPHI